ncbi:S-adenosyl-L-methionine-dependent methyltransferase [Polychytrium aggregatum]|uniref:S-adenosyl-L-methionine-dependent methyltransferase n=1 Tax=Polychytrium aggregatum TaxID=110093 RepID=UPI0022FE54ED|nr:S-adenosyl-L-methionine-dependent methyltransferase [Polychytrium aggregatum]KAI9204841.1 S-adenosyl-L-methionine-dependent methyltransferase [Polychytrium aggregatum]
MSLEASTGPAKRRLSSEQHEDEPKKLKHDDGHAESDDQPRPGDTDRDGDGNRREPYPRLRVSELPQHTNAETLAKYLVEWGVKHHKIKKAPGWSYAFVSFESTALRDASIKLIDGQEIKGNIVRATETVLRDDRRPARESNIQDDRTPAEVLADQVTPLWRKSYPVQLDEKAQEMGRALGKFKRKMQDYVYAKDSSPRAQNSIAWVKSAIQTHKNLCPILPIIPSPVERDYRTKCEFSMGRNQEGEAVVGFLTGLFKKGCTTVLEPAESLHISLPAKHIASETQAYIRKSQLPIYDRVEHTGFWRALLVRTHSTGENMVVVQVNPVGVTPDNIQKELEAYKQHLLGSAATGDVEITTILAQQSAESFNGFHEKTPYEVLHGPGVVHEKLLGTSFRISPTAFFQINTLATEQLFSLVRKWCRLEGTGTSAQNNNTVLLDLCCGTGTIGLTMARQVKKVIGVEIVQQAVEDAKANAAENGIENVVYIAKPAEEAMSEVFAEHVSPGDNVVAVLDPPRAGMHAKVIKAIRECKALKRLIYISCDANAVTQNFADLCRPISNKFPDAPFRPVRAQPVDLFPHTKHCELVVEFERVDLAAGGVATDEGAAEESHSNPKRSNNEDAEEASKNDGDAEAEVEGDELVKEEAKDETGNGDGNEANGDNEGGDNDDVEDEEDGDEEQNEKVVKARSSRTSCVAQ